MESTSGLEDLRERFSVQIRNRGKEVQKGEKRERFIGEYVALFVRRIVSCQPENPELPKLIGELSEMFKNKVRIPDYDIRFLVMKLKNYLVRQGDLARQSIHMLSLLSGYLQKKVFPFPEFFIKDIILHCFTPALIEDSLWSIANLLTLSNASQLSKVVESTFLQSEISNILQNQIESPKISPNVLWWFLEKYFEKVPGSELDSIALEYLSEFFIFEDIGGNQEIFPLLRVLSERNDLMRDSGWRVIILSNIGSKGMLVILEGILSNYQQQCYFQEVLDEILANMDITCLSCQVLAGLVRVLHKMAQNPTILRLMVFNKEYLRVLLMILNQTALYSGSMQLTEIIKDYVNSEPECSLIRQEVMDQLENN